MIVISGSPSIKRKFFAKEISPSWPYFYLSNDFSIPRMDVGIFSIKDLKLDPDDSNPAAFKQSYKNIISAHKEHNGELIIGGTFSKVFIDKILEDFDDVKILHIIRHPTVSYVMNIPVTYPEDSPVGLEYAVPFTIASICDNIILSNVDYVTTYKFEDIISNRKFIFNNKEFKCPLVHNNYNGLITNYEFQMNRRKPITTSETVTKFNEIFSNLNSNFINGHNDNRLPKNVFNDLNYTPIEHSQIFEV